MRRLFFQPVDLASLAVFRIAFGVLMLVEVLRYASYGWITSYYVAPTFHFTYPGFGWVQPWPGNGMYWHFGLLGLLAVMIAAGALYRVAMASFCLAFTYVFLLEQAHYLNHLYLVCLLSFLLVFVPANRLWSVDARLGWAKRSDHAPRWTLLLIQSQIGLVYFFGGIAKLDGDWLSGAPGAMFLREWAVTAPIADLPHGAQVFALSGTLFDLSIFPLLMWRRSRPFAAVAAVLFHLTNMKLFQIGIFPWLMLASLGIYFAPSWPRAVLSRLRLGVEAQTPAQATPGRFVLPLLAVWFTIQFLLPLRHWLYPGEVNWTEEGHNFSWHMKLRNKSGQVRMFLVDAQSGQGLPVDLSKHLTRRQQSKMSTRPDMIQLFAQHVAERTSRELGRKMSVHADVWVSLNGRPAARMIDPTLDLASEPRDWRASRFILPMPAGVAVLATGDADD